MRQHQRTESNHRRQSRDRYRLRCFRHGNGIAARFIPAVEKMNPVVNADADHHRQDEDVEEIQTQPDQSHPSKHPDHAQDQRQEGQDRLHARPSGEPVDGEQVARDFLAALQKWLLTLPVPCGLGELF